MRSVNALGSVVANHCIVLSIYNSTSLANQLLILLSLKRLAIHGPTTSSISVLGCSFEYMTIGLLQLVILAPSVDCTTAWSGAEDVLKSGCCNCRMLQGEDSAAPGCCNLTRQVIRSWSCSIFPLHHSLWFHIIVKLSNFLNIALPPNLGMLSCKIP
jgi:hypothetical protein